MRLIDLSHSFKENMPTYPGDPNPELTPIARLHSEGYNDHLLKTGMHVGTHVDAPFHMIENGKRMSELPLEKFTGNGVLLDARGRKEMGAELLHGTKIHAEDIVLVYTGWDKKFNEKEYFDVEAFPKFSEELARELVKAKIKLVGMDTASPDREPFNVHKILLGNGILIMENLCNLDALLGVKKFEVMAFPVKFYADGGMARVVAKTE